MKKILALTAGLLCAVMAVAGPNSVTFIYSTIATNGATSGIVTNESVQLHGYIDMLVIDSALTNRTDIDIVTKAASGTGPSRTIISTNDMTADVTIYPRVFSVHTTAGASATQVEGTRIPLVGDVLQCWLQSETNSQTAQVWVILSPVP